MNCERIAALMDALVDGELSAAEAIEAAEHLSKCASCRAAERARAESVRLVREHGAERAPDGFAESVKRKLAVQPVPAMSVRTPSRKRFVFSPPAWASLAASFVLLLASGFLIRSFVVSPSGNIATTDKSISVLSEAPDPRFSAPAPEVQTPPEPGFAREDSAANASDGGSALADEDLRAAAPEAAAPADASAPPAAPVEEIVLLAASARAGAGAVVLGPSEGARMAAAAIAERQIASPPPQPAPQPEAIRRRSSDDMPAQPEAVSSGRAPAPRMSDPRPTSRPASPASAFSSEPFTLVAAKQLRGELSPRSTFDSFSAMASDPASSLYEIEMPDGGKVVYRFAPPAGEESQPHFDHKAARASDAYTADNPVAAAVECEKIVSSALSRKPGEQNQWQRTESRIIVKGSFETLRRLRLEIMKKFEPAQAAEYSAREEKELAASREFSPDMRAVLEIRFIGKR
ncbi:MAG TPA: zf-HC2 domain-containing protein [bacterium]|nr:zf-HC2 domain-containing protein [bacterium]